MTNHYRATADPIVTTGDGRTLEGTLVPYMRVAMVDDGDGPYREQFARNSVQLAAGAVPVYGWHTAGANPQHGPVIGRVVAGSHSDGGFSATMRVADTTAGRDALALMREGIHDQLSIEFADDEDHHAPDGTVTRVRAHVTGVALVLRGAYQGAAVTALRSEPQPVLTADEVAQLEDTRQRHPSSQEVTTMQPDETTTTAADDAGADDEATRARAAASSTRVGDLMVRSSAPAIMRCRSWAEYVTAVRDGTVSDADRETYARAFIDTTTPDVAGLVPPVWLSEVIDLMGASAPTVAAFRQRPLPETGMTVTQPVVTQRPTMAKQTAQKADAASTETLISSVVWPVDTWAGGSDISYQALQRTSPDYLGELMRLYAKEAANKLDAAVCTAMLAAIVVAATPISAASPNDGFITATKVLLNATKRFPEVLVLGVDMWEILGKAKGTDGRPLFPGLSPVNPIGSFTLEAGSGNVRSLTYVVDPNMAATAGVLGLRDAWCTMQSPLQTISADIPLKVGRDVAAFLYAAFGYTDLTGLVELVTAA